MENKDKKGFERENKTENKKRKDGWTHKKLVIGYFDVDTCMKQKQRGKKGKERDKNKEPKERQEGRKKENNKRERERERVRQRKINWKRGRPKKAKEQQRETLKNKQKMPFLRGGKQVFSMRSKETKGTKKTKQNKQKNTKIPKRAFQLSVNFLFLVGVQNFLFWQLGQKSPHPKHTIK